MLMQLCSLNIPFIIQKIENDICGILCEDDVGWLYVWATDIMNTWHCLMLYQLYEYLSVVVHL